jgi:hypothetical protein
MLDTLRRVDRVLGVFDPRQRMARVPYDIISAVQTMCEENSWNYVQCNQTTGMMYIRTREYIIQVTYAQTYRVRVQYGQLSSQLVPALPDLDRVQNFINYFITQLDAVVADINGMCARNEWTYDATCVTVRDYMFYLEYFVFIGQFRVISISGENVHRGTLVDVENYIRQFVATAENTAENKGGVRKLDAMFGIGDRRQRNGTVPFELLDDVPTIIRELQHICDANA